MIAAPIHPFDQDRVKALHALNLLDTPAEERFDRFPRLLTYLFDVPMAYISLVDGDRQWFKATCGLARGETARSISFCGHAIMSEETLVVPDALEDPRFADNPLVTGEPYIRFYAGQPLTGPGGHKIGTLCVADRRPRIFHHRDRTALRDMAHVLEREINLIDTLHLQRRLIEAEEKVVEHQKTMLGELGQAAGYVESLLPEPLKGTIEARWRFTPSSQLGGDCFGYNWIDDKHFAIYLLDVSGHGVGAALLSVSVMNALRALALPNTDFKDPSSVLSSLNGAFPMEQQNGKFFTIWYGVFSRETHSLTYAAAGHPPALLVSRRGHNGTPPNQELGMGSFAVGMMPGATFTSATAQVPAASRLYVFSDGTYEIQKPDGSMMHRQDLVAFLTSPRCPCGPDEVWDFVSRQAQSVTLQDDFSILEISFP